MLQIFKENVVLNSHARPGHWNDPDMLEVGNGGMSDIEYRSHFSLWAIMAAPLKILLNKEVIAVDQDALGVQGKRIRESDGVHVIVKPLKGGIRAVVVFNETDSAKDAAISATELGLDAVKKYTLSDLWKHSDASGDGAIKVKLAAHATAMYRISAR